MYFFNWRATPAPGPQKIDLGIYHSYYGIFLLLLYTLFTHTMVRNTKGGKGAKSMARKSFASSGTFPIPTSDMEQFAIVSKMYGPSCHVLLNDGSTILCHIRNKFKGRHKSANLISVGSIILIGFRDWESETNRKNADLLFVYDNVQANSLADRFTLPIIRDNYTNSSYDILFDYSTTTTPTDIQTTPSHYDSSFNTTFDFLDI